MVLDLDNNELSGTIPFEALSLLEYLGELMVVHVFKYSCFGNPHFQVLLDIQRNFEPKTTS